MRRALPISSAATTVTSLAFNISLVVWPNALRPYSWAVKYLWVLSILLWICVGVVFVKEHFVASHTRNANPPPPNQNSASSVGVSGGIRLEANPEIHVHIPSANAQPPQTPKVEAPTREHKPLEAHNVKCVSWRIGRVVEVKDGHYGGHVNHFSETQDDNGIPAGLVAFRNDSIPGTPLKQIESIRASVRCRDAGGVELNDGNPSCPWLEEYHNTADFIADVPQTVMVGFVFDGGMIGVWNKRSIFSGRNKDELKSVETYAKDFVMEVRLLDYSGNPIQGVEFDLHCEKGNFTIKRR